MKIIGPLGAIYEFFVGKTKLVCSYCLKHIRWLERNEDYKPFYKCRSCGKTCASYPIYENKEALK